MGKVVDGLKAGLVAGTVFGVILAVIGYFTLIYMKDELISLISADPLKLDLVAEQIYNMALAVGLVMAFAGGILGGLILGAVFGWGYEKIPGRKPVYKGLVFGVILWLVSGVLSSLFIARSLTIYTVTNMAINFSLATIFGILVGFFYRRFMTLKPLAAAALSEQTQSSSSWGQAVLAIMLLLSVVACLLPWLTARVIIDGVNRSSYNYGYQYIIPLGARYTAPIAIANVIGFTLSAYSFKKPQKTRSLNILAGILILVGVIGSFSYTSSAILADKAGALTWSINVRPEYGMSVEALLGFLMIIVGASQTRTP